MKVNLCFLSLLIISVSCLSFGPSYPKDDAKVYLKEKKYSDKIITHVLNQEKLSDYDVNVYSKSENIYVRFLIAENPFLSYNQQIVFLKDNNYVLSALASNRSLNRKILDELLNLGVVNWHLARNPSIPQKILLDLRYEKKVSLVPFAQNPNCPPTIIEEINLSSNRQAKYWLKTVQDWKSEGRYDAKP